MSSSNGSNQNGGRGAAHACPYTANGKYTTFGAILYIYKFKVNTNTHTYIHTYKREYVFSLVWIRFAGGESSKRRKQTPMVPVPGLAVLVVSGNALRATRGRGVESITKMETERERESKWNCDIFLRLQTRNKRKRKSKKLN